MEFRIQAFEILYRERLRLRLSAVGPGVDPDVYHEILALPRPKLTRQDNRHHLLPPNKFADWLAGDAEDKERIMAEYDALNYDDDADEVYDMLLLE
jgi:hypothetical protein